MIKKHQFTKLYKKEKYIKYTRFTFNGRKATDASGKKNLNIL